MSASPIRYPPGAISRWGATRFLTGDEADISYTSWDGTTTFALSGPHAPEPSVQEGVVLCGGIRGLTPGFDQIKLKSARQPGATWTGTVYNELLPQMKVSANSRTPQGLSEVVSRWIGAWRPDRTGLLEWFTQDRGYWYINPRLAQPWPDTWAKLPRTLRQFDMTHQFEHNAAFWYGMPKFDTFAPGGSGGSGFLTLTNIGDQDACPQLLCYGPGTFAFSNGVSTGTNTTITFGPLEDGQVVLLDTRTRMQAVIDLTQGTPTLPVTPSQKMLETIINWVSNNNVPPLLQKFESLFGIPAPQGPLQSLLTGMFTNPIAGVAQPSDAVAAPIAVTITGGTAASKVVARLDPMRVWPE